MKRKLLVLTVVLFVLLLLVSLALFLQGRDSDDAPVQTGAPAEAGTTSKPSPPPTPEPTPIPTPAPQYAAQLLSLTLDAPQAASSAVLDGNLYTDYTFEGGTTLTLSSDSEIFALYVIFGTYPGNWTLCSGGTEQPCGQDGFLHECVFLDCPATSIELVLPDEDVMIRDIYAFSDGYLPTYVQTWHNIREDEGADILLFSTHYDDELRQKEIKENSLPRQAVFAVIRSGTLHARRAPSDRSFLRRGRQGCGTDRSGGCHAGDRSCTHKRLPTAAG